MSIRRLPKFVGLLKFDSYLIATMIVFRLTCFASTAMAQSQARYIREIMPRGVQRGTETQITITGGWLAEAEEIIFYRPGLKATNLKPGQLDKDAGAELKATLLVAADCPLGEHALRVRSKSGLTTLHTIYVGPYPHVNESPDPKTFEEPQSIPQNVTVAGEVSAVGEVDYFAIDVKAGQRLSAEVRAARLGQLLFDAHVAILDDRGRVVARSDDTGLGFQDPIAAVMVPKSGKYRVAVRESGYGNEGSYKRPKGKYLLHVGSFVRPLSIMPAGSRPSESVEVTFFDSIGKPFQQTFKLFNRRPNGPRVRADPRRPLAVRLNDSLLGDITFGMTGIAPSLNSLTAPTPHPFRVSSHKNIVEREPNDKTTEVARQQHSPSIEAIPIAFNGVIQSRGDADCFLLSAKKNSKWRVEVFARRIGSRMDPVLSIHRPDGSEIAKNDDPRRPYRTSMFRYNGHHSGGYAEDSYIQWTAPEDGNFVIRVADHLKKGGIDYHYRVEATPVKPNVTLWVKRNPPYWRGTPGQSVSVPRGNRYSTIVSYQAIDCPTGTTIRPENLPEGVKFLSVPLSGRQVQLYREAVPVLFEADNNAPLAATLTKFRASDPQRKEAQIKTTFEQSVFYGLNPPNYCFYGVDVDRLAVAVARKAPLKLDVADVQALHPGRSSKIRIAVERDPDFKHPTVLELLYLPPGISAKQSKPISAGRSEAVIEIQAAKAAKPGRWPMTIVARGNASLHGGGISTGMFHLEVMPVRSESSAKH